MRNILRSGRRRYALVLSVIAGSLVLMAATCAPTKEPIKEPAPTEEPAPAPTGLSISPTEHDFGDQPPGAGPTAATTFTVTNNGPDTSGALDVDLSINFNPDDFVTSNDNCTGNTLADDASCTIDVEFDPDSEGQKLAELVAVSDDLVDGKATANVSGRGLDVV